MAGSFGFERDHYDVSIAIGERVLLPTVRDARRDTLIVADGFSCREQIAQTTERRALHLADVLMMAMREGPAGPPGDYPERGYAGTDTGRAPPIGWRTVAVSAIAGAVMTLVTRRLRRVSPIPTLTPKS
jgi:hypothetical protein